MVYLVKMNRKMVIAILPLLFNGKARDKVSIVQRTDAKESENGFLGLLCDSPLITERTLPFSLGNNYLLFLYIVKC